MDVLDVRTGRRGIAVLLAVLSLSTAGCSVMVAPSADRAAAPPVSAAMGGEAARPEAARWLRTELYFATGRADGPADEGLDAAAWQAFLDEEVTPRFPDGFTVLDAYGQWRMKNGTRIGRLRTKVIVILHPDTEAARAQVEGVRLAFKRRTGQDSVLRATAPVEVSF